jgi:hypothetical protein
VNPIRPPARCRMPAASALGMPVDARFDPAAATTRSSVGRAAAATTRSPTAALDGSAASRMPSSACRSSGTGRGSPGAGRTPARTAPGRSQGRTAGSSRDPVQPQQDGTGEIPPVRARSRRVIASSRSGPMATRCRLGTGPVRPRASGSPPEPTRSATRIRGASSRRRTHERQHPGRGRIQPLDIVDRDDHRGGGGQGAQDAQRRDRHRSLVRWRTLGLCPQERGIQRPPLRRREIRQLEVEQVTERRIGQPGLRFGGAAGKHPMTPCPRERHTRAPQCRLADPGRSLKEQGRGPLSPTRRRTAPRRPQRPAPGSREPARPSNSTARQRFRSYGERPSVARPLTS